MAASAVRRLAAPVATLLVSSVLAGCIIVEDDPPPRRATHVEPVSTLSTDPGRLMRCTTGNTVLDYKVTARDIGWSPIYQNRWTARFCNTGERPRMQGTINTVCNINGARAWSMSTSVQPFGISVVEEEIDFADNTIVVHSKLGNKPSTTRHGTCYPIDGKGRRIDE